MRQSSRTQGATLIASLLLVVVLLAAIMAVTAQITLSTRRSSADQEQIGRAQYAAESGVARVQSRLRLMQDLLADSGLPESRTGASVEGDVAALCGTGSLPVYTNGVQELCSLERSSSGLRTFADASNPRVALFVGAVDAAVFAKHGLTDASEAVRSAFWSQLFSGTQGVTYAGGTGGEGQYRLNFGVQPTRVLRTGPNTYRVEFRVPDLPRAEGTAGGATRRLSVTAAQPDFYLLVDRPPFSRYALFTNHHFSSPGAERDGDRITFTDRTLFSGPVHSNQQFRFQGRPWFGDNVTSAGCPAGQINAADNGCATSLQPGAWFGGAPEFLGPAQMTPSPDAPEWCPAGTAPGACAENPAVKPGLAPGVKWDSDYIALPANANDQAAAAGQGGLLLNGNVSELQLRRDEIGGREVQRVTYTQEGRTVDLAYGSDRRLHVLDENGVWQPAARGPDGAFVPNSQPGAAGASFNGVIHVEGAVGNLNAGAGNTTTEGAQGAAVASFAGLTLSAAGDVNVTSNLRYANPPCSGGHTRGADGSVTPAPCANQGAENMLGLFSSGGDINLVSPASCPGTPGSCPSLRANPVIHAVMMASRGAVQVQGYDQGPADNSLGSVNLIGGVIENYYGAFGITDGRGFGRNFVYDPRMGADRAPPFFPTQRQWTLRLGRLNPDGSVGPALRLGDRIRLSGDAVNARGDRGSP